MQTDLAKVYDYMQSINCIDKYIHNYEKDIDYAYEKFEKCCDPITYAFDWNDTSEGGDYWCDIDTAIMELHVHLSAANIYLYLKGRTEIPDCKETYEYW